MKHLRTGEPHAGGVATASPLRRPVALRIDKSVEDFYAETKAANIPSNEVHDALAESHQWRRNWTTDLPPSSSAPEVDMFISFREAGARNPSPRSPEDEKKRGRSEIYGSEGPNLVEDDGEPVISDLSMSPEDEEEPILLRPMALRIGKKTTQACIPKIIQDMPDISRPISPMTFYSTSSTLSETSSRTKQSGQICTTPNTLLQQAREGILRAISISGGETDSEEFLANLEILQDHFVHNDEFERPEGMWLALTKPAFFGCLGDNDAGDPMYTLSRMSFDMFSPGELVCSLQGNFNEVDQVKVSSMQDQIPPSLVDEVNSGSTVLRTYNIVTPFTIEPPIASQPNAPNNAVRAPINAIMTTFGYMIEDPSKPRRKSVWITGGRVEPNNTQADQLAWKNLFTKHPPKHNLGAQAKLLAVKWLMGAVIPDSIDPETGVMEYEFTKPLGGHGLAYIDTLYCDETLRIIRGHRGTYFVFVRVGQD